MGDLELGAAYEAGVRALDANYTGDDRDAHNAIDAALPHIERAVIQRLIAKASTDYIALEGIRLRVIEWLRAELAGKGGTDE